MQSRSLVLITLLLAGLPGRAGADAYGSCHLLGPYDWTHGDPWRTAFIGRGESASVSAGSFVRLDLFGKVITPPGVVPLPPGACGTEIHRVDAGFLLTEWVGDTLQASTLDEAGGLVHGCTTIYTRPAGGARTQLAARERALAIAWIEPGATAGSRDLYLQPIDLATLTPTRTKAASLVVDGTVPVLGVGLATTGSSFGLVWRSDASFFQVYNVDGSPRTAATSPHTITFDYVADYDLRLAASASSYGLHTLGWYTGCLCTWYVSATIRDEAGVAAGPSTWQSCPEEMTTFGIGFAEGLGSFLLEDSFQVGGYYTAGGTLGFGPEELGTGFPMFAAIRGTAGYSGWDVYDCTVEMAGPFYFVRDGAGSDDVRIECPATFGSEFQLHKGAARDLSDLASLGYRRACPIVDTAAATAPGLTIYRLGP